MGKMREPVDYPSPRPSLPVTAETVPGQWQCPWLNIYICDNSL